MIGEEEIEIYHQVLGLFGKDDRPLIPFTFIKNKTEYQEYLDLNEDANDGGWKGFKPRTAVGLELRHAAAK